MVRGLAQPFTTRLLNNPAEPVAVPCAPPQKKAAPPLGPPPHQQQLNARAANAIGFTVLTVLGALVGDDPSAQYFRFAEIQFDKAA